MEQRERQKARSIRHVFQKFVERSKRPIWSVEKLAVSRARETERYLSATREKERERPHWRGATSTQQK